MRASIIVGAALAGLVAASPVEKRQELQLDQFDAADVPVLTGAPVDPNANPGSYDPEAAVAAAADTVLTSDGPTKVKRAACDALPAGSGPTTSPDTASAFLSNPVYPSLAASASNVDGYTNAFVAINNATQNPAYITYKTLDSYDPYTCQRYCDGNSACYGFNIYFERDPSVSPGAACPDPASTTTIKCALFGAQLDSKTAINKGQYRNKFQVVIAGSNGYSKVAAPDSVPGWTPPVEFAGAVNAPDNSYMTYKYFAGPYNPAQCLAATETTNQYNKDHPKADGTYDTAVFVNTYVLSKNGVPQGTQCSLYTKTWGTKYAVNYGQYRGNDRYTVSQSYGWSLAQAE